MGETKIYHYRCVGCDSHGWVIVNNEILCRECYLKLRKKDQQNGKRKPKKSDTL